jgi:hypothetical protein
LDKEGVGIVTWWQEDAASIDAMHAEPLCEQLGGLLTALVGINIEGEIDGA